MFDCCVFTRFFCQITHVNKYLVAFKHCNDFCSQWVDSFPIKIPLFFGGFPSWPCSNAEGYTKPPCRAPQFKVCVHEPHPLNRHNICVNYFIDIPLCLTVDLPFFPPLRFVPCRFASGMSHVLPCHTQWLGRYQFEHQPHLEGGIQLRGLRCVPPKLPSWIVGMHVTMIYKANIASLEYGMNHLGSWSAMVGSLSKIVAPYHLIILSWFWSFFFFWSWYYPRYISPIHERRIPFSWMTGLNTA